MAVLQQLVSPLSSELSASLRACGQVRLTVRYENGAVQEHTRTFVTPMADPTRLLSALEQLLGQLSWPAPATGLSITLEQIRVAV